MPFFSATQVTAGGVRERGGMYMAWYWDKNIKRMEQNKSSDNQALNAEDQISEPSSMATDTYQLSPNMQLFSQDKEQNTILERSLISPLETTSCCLPFSTYPAHLYRNHHSAICPGCVHPEVVALSLHP